ncbi:hypothetical protein F889_02735 [Acinetobacter colistiniresistens]|uniref:Uncharacterized protein n=1 Tax=Acinetobacter colistiniresistens TaxID=280145 RepID=N9QVN0_9GAMM|nr:hypothetical protein [Acinetobacter colistiniresistens]ENX34071.1 hypothetical protein F889_02735 [Acinetobacter colistiniresistens]EPG37714.1 hypothetical protein F907_01684 [Acinetobacter colistiniresistens]TVT78961.1 hypothetical protein FPV60_15810 [Acinetobacter colistiniresistens]
MNIIKQKLQPDWWTKTFVGFFLGLSFALAMGAIIVILSKSSADTSIAPQLGMWSIPWFWLFAFFIAYFIPKGWQSAVIFSLINVVAYALLFWLRA